MTEPKSLNGSIEGDTTDSVLSQLRGIKESVAKLPQQPTEVVGFQIDPAVNTQTTKQASHVKINVQTLIISQNATASVISFNIGGRSFPFYIEGGTGSIPSVIPFPIKWDRGVDAWFSADKAQTALNCYVIGTAE